MSAKRRAERPRDQAARPPPGRPASPGPPGLRFQYLWKIPEAPTSRRDQRPPTEGRWPGGTILGRPAWPCYHLSTDFTWTASDHSKRSVSRVVSSDTRILGRVAWVGPSGLPLALLGPSFQTLHINVPHCLWTGCFPHLTFLALACGSLV